MARLETMIGRVKADITCAFCRANGVEIELRIPLVFSEPEAVESDDPDAIRWRWTMAVPDGATIPVEFTCCSCRRSVKFGSVGEAAFAVAETERAKGSDA